jgi:hypothetical protein|tara:strand:+ start:61 stop:336 length:276 start_codon:yes stop_codon:yes gene_type:complete
MKSINLKTTKLNDSMFKWTERFYDVIYLYYCKGNGWVDNGDMVWNLQKELKFIHYIQTAGEYTDFEAKQLNSVGKLYKKINKIWKLEDNRG